MRVGDGYPGQNQAVEWRPGLVAGRWGGRGVPEKAWEGTCVPGAWSHGGGLSGTSWGVPWPAAGMLGCFTQAASRRGLPVAVGLG